MAYVEIPIGSETAFFQRVLLDNVEYVLDFTFNTFIKKWFLDISNNNNEILVYGVPLFSNIDLLKQYKLSSEIPQGILMCFDTNNANKDPDLKSFGLRTKLIYREVGT